MKIGSRVRIIEDEYPEMIGLVGTIVEFSNDGTAAVVQFAIPVWCAVYCLEEVTDEDLG